MRLEPETPSTSDDLVVVVTGDAIDPDAGPQELQYTVRWLRDGLPTPNSGLTLPASQTRRGELWQVEVAGFDGELEGPVTEASVTIGNAPPSLTHVDLEPREPTVEDVLVCDPGVISDPDGDDVSLTYRWFRDALPIEGATTAGLQPPLVAGSTYQCSAAPFDGELEGEVRGSNIVTPTEVISTEALITVTPGSIDLGTVIPGETVQATVSISNVGDAPLTILDVRVEGDPGFSVDAGAVVGALAPDTTVEAVVTFSTDVPGLQKGQLIVDSNASNQPQKQVPVLGIGAAPCLSVEPSEVVFGGVYAPAQIDTPVTLRSCGALPVTVSAITIDGGEAFGLDLAPMAGALPLELAPGAETFFRATFEPQTASATDASGQPVPETGTVSIVSDAPQPVTSVPVSGFAAAGGCPVAIASVVQGDVVSPQTELMLSANASFGAFGVPSLVSWSINSLPSGETPMPLSPAADAHEVTYTVGGPGQYTFELRVFDQTNDAGMACGEPANPCTQVIPGCSSAFVTVEVSDAMPLSVELTWDTPGDPNPADTGAGKGADLDLHMHNGTGSGDDYDQDGEPDSWFDMNADCYWLDASPDWGAPGPVGDPALVAEDADGQGPERIDFGAPEPGEVYTVGVHYWSDYGFGSSIVTVRVFRFGQLTSEFKDVVITSGDLLEVADIAWPSGLVSPAFGADGGPKVTPDYPNPFFSD